MKRRGMNRRRASRRLAALLATGLAVLPACRGTPGQQDDHATESAQDDEGDSADTSDGQPNTPPPVPNLLSPTDGAEDVAVESELCWQPVEDAEGAELHYRVYVDGTELTRGLDEPVGYPGPCVGPLLFAHERSYTWAVEAFEVDAPTVRSGLSESWSFTTVGDGLSDAAFVDHFEDGFDWLVEGDAFAGAWVWGQPAPAFDQDLASQPPACAGGGGCVFTGQNSGTVADNEDVSGGATILTSPAFDLDGAAAASVRLERFFYKSDLLDEAPAELEVALLVPDPAAPGGQQVLELELLEAGTGEQAANLWTPREYLACDSPMVAGTRLRITARDQGSGILEAAIDTVSVHGLRDTTACEVGEAGACDPSQGEGACPGELLCCSQGAVNRGIYRCEQPVPGLDFSGPPASPDAPGNGPLGCDAADLMVQETWLEPQTFTEIFMSDDACELLEGCVVQAGWRRVMLFTVGTPNIGSRDLALGVPANEPDLFHYSDCHDHFHFEEYARYQLLDGEEVVATGHKQAFCLFDSSSWAWPTQVGQFDCSNQGISRGFIDFYEAGLPCQWIDVTDVPPGDYTLRVSLNQPRPGHALPILNERDYANNVVSVPVSVP